MSKINMLRSLTDEEILEICDNFTSAQEYLRSVGISGKGQYGALLNSRRTELCLEWKLASNRITDKICPVCEKKFKPGTKSQTTCSYSCSNTHFRSGKDNPNYKYGGEQKEYRRVCFGRHPKECIICGEDKIVAVHHYDENHENNDIKNLVPLCPTHHQYVHSKYKYLVEDKIKDWISNV